MSTSDDGLTPEQTALWHSFVDGGWALMAQVNSVFSAHGWTTTDLRILEVLASRQQFGISELATTVHMGVSTVSRQIGRMIDTGDVVRVRSDLDGRHRLVRITDDGRATLLVITDAGRERVQGMRSMRREAFNGAMSDWTQEELSTLVGLLDRFVDAAEQLIVPAHDDAKGHENVKGSR